MAEEYDLVVVGAGIYGLPVAKTYVEAHPSARILVLDAEKSVGGTWAAERIYDGLKSNNNFGGLEWSDFPMDGKKYGLTEFDHVPGHLMHEYLTSYARKFGVFERIRFQTKVKSAELRNDDKWLLRYDDNNGQGELITKKLVMATGATSDPNMPVIAGMEKFDGTVFHTKEIGSRLDDISAAESVVVLGGSKSAGDAVYTSASMGKHVDWVIRESGRGPSWFSHIRVSPLRISLQELCTTRIMTWLCPSFDADAYPNIRWALHNTRIGRALVKGFFAIIQDEAITRGRYNEHPETKKLIPRQTVFWAGTAVGVWNYPTELFAFVRKGLVNVHIEDIEALSPHTVHFVSGKSITADTFICATGYHQRPTVELLPASVNQKVGFCTLPSSDPKIRAADAEIMRRYPELQHQPPAGPTGLKELEDPSYALWRGIVPPQMISSHNLAFAGASIGLCACLLSESQALWITAFLDGRLSKKMPSVEEAEWEASLLRRFWRYRAPNGEGKKGPDMVFEIMPYLDTLLGDLGLNTARKGGWREIFQCYGVHDYKGIVREWLEKEGLMES